MNAAIAAGLNTVDALKPGHGFAEVMAGVSTSEGAFARGEVGWHPSSWASLFGFGEVSALPGQAPVGQAGAGARITF